MEKELPSVIFGVEKFSELIMVLILKLRQTIND